MNNSTKRQLLCRHPFIYRKWVTAALLLWWALCLALPAAAQDLAVSHPQLPLKFSSIKIFDNKGRYVGRILPEQRYWVSIDRIHPFLKKAVVAIEDARFYEHPGIDVRGIARALVKDVAKGRIVEGGSTITQQLIKNKYLSGKKTLDRKIQEVSLDAKLTK